MVTVVLLCHYRFLFIDNFKEEERWLRERQVRRRLGPSVGNFVEGHPLGPSLADFHPDMVFLFDIYIY